jgi:hypothetical protein
MALAEKHVLLFYVWWARSSQSSIIYHQSGDLTKIVICKTTYFGAEQTHNKPDVVYRKDEASGGINKHIELLKVTSSQLKIKQKNAWMWRSNRHGMHAIQYKGHQMIHIHYIIMKSSMVLGKP